MRNEQVMMDLIINTAMNDERIRVVLMNGSRVNPNAKKDFLQDYDVVYLVNDIESFTSDHSWVNIFGERIIMQMPEDMVLPPADGDERFVYLMWFKDGNRIDLTLIPIEKKNQLLKPDSLTKLIVDKDGIIGNLPPSSDEDYHINRPSAKEYDDICNEYWWICMNIGKGLWREELTYTKFMYEQINRNVLIQMIEWYIGTQTDFKKSAGNRGKYIEDFLNPKEWAEFVETYADAKYENIWESLFKMCNLFRKISRIVADRLDFVYPIEEDKNVIQFLKHLQYKPKN
ncbi:aminoglycoside 6-adenylyltransferase [Peribacillus alkalitolerans]|uniref:aminoglycoside 6-adenylyltransferase n=1 Tax=Peribacillus alkalitolerans TaxID=1550385 RepID=UPI0013D4B06B|nr:aminoglycoside 6-adenylyltransferase [Peribacillus alkalitolerans]